MRRPARSARACAAACCTASPTRSGATKIALGHHLDDFIETLLLNLFFGGALKAMPARLVSDDQRHVVIRPLVYVSEQEALDYAMACELPIVGCCCPACGDLGLQRQRLKRLIGDLEREHPGIKSSMLKAIQNVHPRHLLDTRLNPRRTSPHRARRGRCDDSRRAPAARLVAAADGAARPLPTVVTPEPPASRPASQR